MLVSLPRRIFGLSALALLATASPGPAGAQASAPAPAEPGERTLAAGATEAWQHAETRMTLPPQVAGLTRVHVRDNGTAELDVVTNYVNRDEGVIALVYIYRTMTPNVPLWFDRALDTIMLPQQGVTAPRVTAFARPGASIASGLRTATTDSVPGMRSTTLAILPLGSSWLVKIRLGSIRLDPAALDERMSAFIAALQWPAETGTPHAAAPIEPCPTPLRLRPAHIVNAPMEDVLVDAATGSIEPDRDQPPPVYCREPGATIERGVYRADGATDSYLIALHDAGIAISVGETLDLASLLGERGGRHRYSVILLERNSSSVYPSFDRLPPPDQALAVVRDARSPLSTTAGARERR